MKSLGLREVAERFVQGHPATWMAIAISMMAVMAFAAVLLIGLVIWIWESISGQQDVVDIQKSEVVVNDSTFASQVLQPVPFLIAGTPSLVSQDVSGTDPGPVERFPGLVRAHWHRDGREITVRYEGEVNLDDALIHYVNGFATRGYTQRVLASDGMGGVKHEYVRGNDKVKLALSSSPEGWINLSIISVMP